MAVSLPISATVKPVESRAPKVEQQAPAKARASTLDPRPSTTSIRLPLAFILTGLAALLLGAGGLVAQPSILASYHYNQYVIALTHLFVLGFLGSIVMGAMYQLVPVALETKLYSERLARWQFAFHLVGVIGMVWMFWKWDLKQVGHFGTVLTMGVGLFVFNLAQTLRRVPKWNVTATAVAAALFWISLTVIAGLSIATGKCTYESTSGLATLGGVKTLVSGLRTLAGFMSNFDAISAMHAHAHLGGVGFFTLLIVGVSCKLIPMFVLSEVQKPPPCRILCGFAQRRACRLVRGDPVAQPVETGFCARGHCHADDLWLGTCRHPARPQTPVAGLGHSLLRDSSGVADSRVPAFGCPLLARPIAQPVRRPVGKPLRLPGFDGGGDVCRHGHAL